MSQENMEIVRQALRAFDRDLDRVAEFWDPDIDWRAIEAHRMTSGSLGGTTRCAATTSRWYEMFDDLRVNAEELIDAGGDRVVTSCTSSRE
jgi:ketosteroid isomerase-like protein